MVKFKLDYDINCEGYTMPALCRLRNELANRYDCLIDVYMLPVSDITCGFLIVDYGDYEDGPHCIWSGAGFRIDGGGEGGSGYRSARALLDVFGIIPDNFPQAQDLFVSCSDEGSFKAALRKFIEEYNVISDDWKPKHRLYNRKSIYLRNYS